MTKRSPAISFVLCALLLLASAGSARAQQRELEPAEREEARALFVAGSAAVEGGRWADAVDSFERAYALTGAPSALYNLAIALRALGRHREARDAFGRLLDHHTVGDEELRTSAARMRSEEAARVAVLELIGLDAEVEHAIRFDGHDVAQRGEGAIEIETDAGNHTLIAEREGFQPFVWEGTLADGQRQSVRAVFRALSQSDDTLIHVVLVAVGVAALAAGGAVLGWYLYEDAQVQPLYPMQVEP